MSNAPLAPATLVAEGLGKDRIALFVGDQIAASDDRLLLEHGIVNVLNCAVNCDINYVDRSHDLDADGARRTFGFAPFRTAKVGLVDGAGNAPVLMLAAVHVLHGMLSQTFPQKESYRLREPGNVLVHCRGGRSRSVAVAALYLHRVRPQRWPGFETTVDEIRTLRGIPADEFDRVPTAGILDTARAVLRLFDADEALL